MNDITTFLYIKCVLKISMNDQYYFMSRKQASQLRSYSDEYYRENNNSDQFQTQGRTSGQHSQNKTTTFIPISDLSQMCDKFESLKIK